MGGGRDIRRSGEYTGKWINPAFVKTDDEDAREDRLFDAASAAALAEGCAEAPVASVVDQSEDDSKLPPKLFDLTTLQREANRKFGFTAAHTLAVAQALYETHKVLTYLAPAPPALPEDYLDTVLLVLEAFKSALAPFAKKALDNGYVKLSKRIFDDSKISDHFAIIPTGLQPAGLEADEQKIYDLVARRFIAGVLSVGAVQENGPRHAGERPHLQVQRYGAGDARMAGGQWPRGRRRQGTRVRRGGRAARRQRDHQPGQRDQAAQALHRGHATWRDGGRRQVCRRRRAARGVEEAQGLGTPATRASIIEGLLEETERKKPYFVRDGKDFVPTAKAMHLVPFLREHSITELCTPPRPGNGKCACG